MVEKLSEDRKDREAIGTTSRGIGPCYEDKIGRRGIRIADLIDEESFEALYENLANDKVTLAKAFGVHEAIDFAAIRSQYRDMADRIKPLVTDTASFLNARIREGKRVLFEGAQGAMLDIDHGTYPFVTSSNATAGGACTGTGVPPTKIDGIIGVSKAYITRVGAGAFPTEEHGPAGDLIRKLGNEFGSVTGRPRRCGWFDVPLARYTAAVNGLDTLIVTKLDVLDELDEIPVCVGYTVDGQTIHDMPATRRGMEAIQPVYHKLPGWKSSTRGITSFTQLPAAARIYLDFLEEKTGIEVGSISTGPERTETIIRAGSKLEKLLG
jgi:adenylosuccinate synthase